MDVRKLYQEWLDCPGMPDELLDELKQMNDTEINDSFYRDLAFGTGGLRGVLGAGTNKMNIYTVMKATRGLGQYLKEAFDRPSCAISCDSRIHSRDFAELAAAALAEMGIKVFLYPKLQPTPMLSYAVRHLECSAGVMITASHNPAKFNGYKVYGPDGCQITLEAADRTQQFIDAESTLRDSMPDFDGMLRSGMIEYIGQETIESYYNDVLKLSIHSCSAPLHLVYSPLNGTGNVPVREIMKRMGNISVEIVEEQEMPDGHFPTCPYPNPEIREAMRLAIAKTVETGADFCFATDPDCDRIGAGVRIGNDVQLITGNEMGVLLLDYLCRNKQYKGELPQVVVKTIVTTEMAAAICKSYGIELRNVLTGFKFIGEQIAMLEEQGHPERYLFGFEESYGYLSGTDVRDKDAVNAALLVCEMASNLKSEGKTMLDRLNELREQYGFYAQRLMTFEYEGADGAAKMAEIMTALRGDVSELDAVRTDYLYDETGLPKSDVLEFNLKSGEKVIVRPSGTEPKLKAYLFANAGSQAEAEKLLDGLQSIIGKLCKA